MSIMVGTGRGAMAGVLIRNAEALETLEKVDTVVVDKTGTLTEGKPRLVAVVAAAGTGRVRARYAWRRAWNAGASTRSPRPSSRGATGRGLPLSEAKEFESPHRAAA